MHASAVTVTALAFYCDRVDLSFVALYLRDDSAPALDDTEVLSTLRCPTP